MRGRTRTILTRIAVFVLLGAIVNVAVAWGIAIWEPQRLSGISDVTAHAEAIFAEYGLRLSQNQELYGTQSVGRGLTFTTAIVEGDPDNDVPDNFWILTETGWPWRTFAGIFHLVQGMGQSSISSYHFAIELSPSVRSRNPVMPQLAFVLPLRPIWPGFAINTIFYAAVLWLLWVAPGKIRRFIRVQRHRCPACGFIIAPRTCADGRCSECGAGLPWVRRG